MYNMIINVEYVKSCITSRAWNEGPQRFHNHSSVLNVKMLVGAFNQEKALVGAFNVIAKLQSLRMFVSSSSEWTALTAGCLCGADC